MEVTQNTLPKKTMRDSFLSEILQQMERGEKVFLLSADFGAPTLDVIRQKFPKQFINVGIAEQNLINVATGLGLEGYVVYAYAIAPFITMRCCEQIRVNLAILSQVRPMNVNLVGVGAGFSYEVSGPTHHCLEDISIMRTFPNMEVNSPSDWTTVTALAEHCLHTKTPKYLRFDSRPLPQIHEKVSQKQISDGYIEIFKGTDVCLLSTGVLTHKAMALCSTLASKGVSVGLIDMFRFKHFNENELAAKLSKYRKVITLEEGFIGKGGLDALIGQLVTNHGVRIKHKALGLKDTYIFHIGNREDLHERNDLGVGSILREIESAA